MAAILFLTDLDDLCKFCKGPPMDASYQVSVQLTQGFQRRRSECKSLRTDGRRTPSDDKSSHGLWPGELKMCN